MEGPQAIVFNGEAGDWFVSVLTILSTAGLAVDLVLRDGSRRGVVLVAIEGDVLVAESFDTARSDRSTAPVLVPMAEIERIEVH